MSTQNQEDKRRQGPETPKGRNTAENQPSTPQKAKKYKPMHSDEDDEEPQNEFGTSSNSQTTVAVLPLKDQQPVHNDQQPVRKDQLQVLILVMKTVRKAMSTVHRDKTLDEQYCVQISTFEPMMNIGH